MFGQLVNFGNQKDAVSRKKRTVYSTFFVSDSRLVKVITATSEFNGKYCGCL